MIGRTHRWPPLLCGMALLAISASNATAQSLLASDHADPLSILFERPREPVLSGLFVFPVDGQGSILSPTSRAPRDSDAPEPIGFRRRLTPEQSAEIQGLVVILCTRPGLIDSTNLDLDPYTYRIHIDSNSPIDFGESNDGSNPDARQGSSSADQDRKPGIGRLEPNEARIRYGGMIPNPSSISADIELEIQLTDSAAIDRFRVIRGLRNTASDQIQYNAFDGNKICVQAGIFDDPFIFPEFFGTNVVAMAVHIPLVCMQNQERDWLVWATSHKRKRQIDHVGRAIRTQNPRFEFLNTVPPHQHVRAIQNARRNPTLMRDVFLELGFESYFEFRPWDDHPDVLIYSTEFEAGFPNGRLLDDDVAAILANHGDSLVYELSYIAGSFPRQVVNDRSFDNQQFPYLAEKWPDRPPLEHHHLSTRNRWILFFLAIVVLTTITLALIQAWQIARRLFFGRPPFRRELI